MFLFFCFSKVFAYVYYRRTAKGATRFLILEPLKIVHKNSDLFQNYILNHDLITWHHDMFQCPVHTLEKFEKGLLWKGLKVYNKIPNNFKCLPLNKFVSDIKEFPTIKTFFSLEEFFLDQI